MIFDTHAHYDDQRFDEDRDEVLSGLKDRGVMKLVNVGADIQTTKNSIALADRYPFIYAAAGVHPSDIDQMNEETYAWLAAQAAHKKVVAIGEIGLDYYWDKDPKVRENQKVWFVRQLELARQCCLPVIIHSRDAAGDTLELMKAHASQMEGVIHCFSSSVEIAREYLKMNYYIGIGGVITFKNSKTLKEVAAYTPLDRIVVETDCPYLAPVPYRGKRNDSGYIPYVIDAIAEIKGISREKVEAQTWKNAHCLYHLKDE